MKKNTLYLALLTLALCINYAAAATYSGVEPAGEYLINDLRGVFTSDLDMDGLEEIVAYTNSMIYVFNSNASLRWTYAIDDLRAVYVSDVDNDQNGEVVAASGRR